MTHFCTTSALLSLAVVIAVIAAILILVVVTRRDQCLEAERANITRASLLVWLAILFVLFVVVAQRNDLQNAVAKLL